ncbi:MAG: hypothetical protein HQ541_12445, partial [Mariniphaga sp.]|nr:hypothetical protein [Mariniphaga sp.]
FWNLKQLASTPENAFSIPFTCNKENVNCAAFGNIAKGEYAIHMVNNGAESQATIKGIPARVSGFDVYVTNSEQNMEKIGEAGVNDGIVQFTLEPAGFTTIISK